MEIYGQPWNWYNRVGHNSLNCEMTRVDGVWLLGPAAEGHRFVLLRRRMLCSLQQLPVPNTWLPFKSPHPHLPVPPDLFFAFHIVLSFASSVLSNPNSYTNMETCISAVPTAIGYGAAGYRRAWSSFVGRTPCRSERPSEPQAGASTQRLSSHQVGIWFFLFFLVGPGPYALNPTLSNDLEQSFSSGSHRWCAMFYEFSRLRRALPSKFTWSRSTA